MSETADRVALRALVERYALAVDRRAGAEVAGLFVPDGVLLVPAVPRSLTPTRERRGRAAIEEALRSLHRYESTFHAIVGHVVDLHGDEAAGVASCLAHHVAGGDDGLQDTVWTLRYQDTYRRQPDGWRFLRRELTVDWIEERPVRQVRGGEGDGA